jgi:hypothetical protein
MQSNYLPWRGYFDLISEVDEFVLYDVVQFTKNDWRNRNRIKTPQGPQWLSIPSGPNISRSINEVEIAIPWRQKHWKSLELSYRRSSYFNEVSSWLKPLYLGSSDTNLSKINTSFIQAINTYFSLNTRITKSEDYVLEGDRSRRLVNICLQADASVYVSAPAARTYLDESLFAREGISVEWFEYEKFAQYPQQWGAFIPNLSVIDFMFNCGEDFHRWSGRKG